MMKNVINQFLSRNVKKSRNLTNFLRNQQIIRNFSWKEKKLNKNPSKTCRDPVEAYKFWSTDRGLRKSTEK